MKGRTIVLTDNSSRIRENVERIRIDRLRELFPEWTFTSHVNDEGVSVFARGPDGALVQATDYYDEPNGGVTPAGGVLIRMIERGLVGDTILDVLNGSVNE